VIIKLLLEKSGQPGGLSVASPATLMQPHFGLSTSIPAASLFENENGFPILSYSIKREYLLSWKIKPCLNL
jgi:hypothetical protein